MQSHQQQKTKPRSTYGQVQTTVRATVHKVKMYMWATMREDQEALMRESRRVTSEGPMRLKAIDCQMVATR